MTNKQQTDKVELKTFDRSDWEIFMGAEITADGSEPQIGEITVIASDDSKYLKLDCLLVVDRTGIQIHPDDPDLAGWQTLWRDSNYRDAIVVASALNRRVSKTTLEDLDFEVIA